MIIRNIEFEACEHCGTRKFTRGPIYGCDCCGAKLYDSDLTVYLNTLKENEVEMHFCSWLCMLRRLKNIEWDGFIDFPPLYQTGKRPGAHIYDFWSAIRQVAKEMEEEG